MKVLVLRTTSANELTSGKLDIARLPNGSEDYVITGRGTNNNPEYAESPSRNKQSLIYIALTH